MIDFDTLVLGPCMATFGEEVTFIAKGGHLPVTITGVFDRSYLQQQPMGGASQESLRAGAAGNVTARKPVLGVQLSQFPRQPPQKGDTVRIEAQDLLYTIQEVQPDGKGGALLILTKST